MATLIQSKQIQGVVTASVVSGEFQVSGSTSLTGSVGVQGTLTATSFTGDGSNLSFGGTNIVSGSSQVTISQTSGYTAFSSSIATSIASIVDSDAQTLSISGDQLSISNGNTITIPTGSGGGASTWNELSGIPTGLISGSTFTDFSSSVDSRIVGISASGSGADWNTNLQNIPVGLVSGSTQITNGSGILSGSIESLLPSGVISGSTQITNGSGIISGSVLRTLDGTGVISGSVLRTLDGTGVVSGSVLRTLDGTGVVSGSVLRTLDGTGVVSGSVLRTLDGTGVFSGSLVAGTNITINQVGDNFEISSSASGGGSTPAGTISSSAQVVSALPDGVVSGSSQITDGSGILSGSIESQLPAGIISGSTYTNFSSSVDSRILAEKTRIDNILDGANADYDQFVEIVNLVNTTDTENDTAFANHYTSSRQRDASLEAFTASIDTTIKTKLNTDDVLSGSIESLLPSGVISSSAQITDGSGIVSGSVLRTLDGTGVFSGSLVAGSNITINQVGNNFEISSSASGGGGGASVTVSDSAPNSPSEGDLWWKSNDGNLYVYYDSYWVISTDVTAGLPAGVVSGSAQITSVITDAYISASAASSGFGSGGGGTSDFTQLTNVPSGLVSGSSQITNASGIISGSVLRTLDGTGVISGSVLRPNGDGVVSGSVLRTLDGTGVVSGSVIRTLDGTGVVSGSVIRTLDGTGVISGSDQIAFNGNRIVSQEKLPTMFTSSFNPGTTGSVVDFLNAIFYPNTEPTINTGNQTIEEFATNGSTIVTVTGTDPEGQSLTFGTASAYTDDLVRVASNGVMTLNALPTSASFNTDVVGGGHGHLVKVTATDTFNATVEKDIYIIVTPNEAPVFRETSAVGNIITSVTSNLNENSADDTLVKRIFFTDAESDTITITTSSIDNNHFDIDIQSNYLDIRQNTGSLDYEQQTTYNFSITASDEHYPSPDANSVTTLPITINVTDNLVPTLSNQSLSSISENSSNGASVGTISAADNEGDSITFVTFELHKLLLDGSEVTSGSYGGTSQATDPHENPFQMSSSGNVTRKTGVYLNSDIINSYQYRVKVRDNYNATISSASVVTIPISDDVGATLSDNWSGGPYIIESAVTNNAIRVNSNGNTGTQADYGSNQSGTWSSSNPAISINSNGSLSIGLDISGSSTGSGDTIDSVITFTNTFGTATTDNLSVSVTTNQAPTINTTSTSNLNTNQATGSAQILVLGINDAEGDAIPNSALSFEGYNTTYFTPVINSSLMYLLVNNTSVPAGTYPYTASLQDVHGFRTNKESGSFTIAQANTGTLGGDTTSYIIESGVSGEAIRDASGFGAGNQSQMTVSYSPNYGSQVVTGSSWTSSNPAISINTSGQLSLGLDISGSTTSSGDDITTTIGFQDQYGNAGSGTVTVNVFANQAPFASFTDQSSNFETDNATTGTTMVSMSISDTESDTPFSASLTGTDASSLQLKYTNSNSSSVGIQASTNLSAATYNYNVKVTDSFGKSRTYSGRSFTITTSADYGKTYIYRSNYGTPTDANYQALMGASSVSGDTPPEVTGYTANNSSPFRLISSSLGNSTLTLASGNATLVATLSGSDLDTIISESNPYTMGATGEQYFIVVPSGSDMTGIPSVMVDTLGGSTAGEYNFAIQADGGSWGEESSKIHLLDTSGSFNGYDKHFVIGRTGQNAASSVSIRILPASGSLPS